MPRFTKERGATGVLEVRDGPETVAAAETAPSAPTDGTDCTGFNTVAVAIHTLVNAPTYSLDVWLFEGGGGAWVQVSGGTGAPATFEDLTATFAQIFNVAGFDRVLVRVSALSALGSIDRVYTFVG